MVLFIYKSKCGCYLGKNIGNIEWGQLTENPNNNNNANTNSNNNRFNRPLTAQQIQAVGAPRGKVSPNNSHGLSKFQNRQLAFLLKIEDSSNLLNQTNSFANDDYRNDNRNNFNNQQYQNSGNNSHNNDMGGNFASWAHGDTLYAPLTSNGMLTMCMFKSNDNINIETTDLGPETVTQVPKLGIILKLQKWTSTIKLRCHMI